MANLRANKITSTEVFETTGSVQFDGNSSTYLTASSSDFAMGTDDFTVEGWVYQSGGDTTNGGMFSTALSDSSGVGIVIARDNMWIGNNSAPYDMISSTFWNLNEWTHVALTRSGTSLRAFRNGILVGTVTSTRNIDRQNAAIGRRYYDNTSFILSGHISNFRILKGTALYTKNFTPPTRELTVIPNTVLLACQSTTNAAREATGKTITVNGNAVANELTPGLLTDRVKSGGSSAISGSVEFDGNDYLLESTGADGFNGGLGDWTVEAWMYCTDASQSDVLVNGLTSSTDRFYINFIGQTLYVGDFSINNIAIGGVKQINSWFHIAVTKSGSTYRAFINGVLIGSSTESLLNSTLTSLQIGYRGSQNYYTKGFISNLRIIKGTAVYTSNFIPPTRELKKLPGTVLLCCKNSNDPTAEETGKTITPYGNATARNFSPQVGFDGSVTFDGVTKINSPNYFYLPTGNTEDRGRGRGVFGGGVVFPAALNTIDYINIQSQGNAQDFGDLTVTTRRAPGSCSSTTRGLFAGGYSAPSYRRSIEFITLSTQSNSTSFGDLTDDKFVVGGLSNNTRGIFGGGEDSPASHNIIDYVTIATLGNAIDFGDMITNQLSSYASCSSSSRGLFAGGFAHIGSSLTNVIQYVTISSTGNSQDFGDLTVTRASLSGCSSPIRGIFGGGNDASVPSVQLNTIDYVTIASTGNATDFGDLISVFLNKASCSSPIRGIFAGGINPAAINSIEFVTIATTGNAQDFGDLITARGQFAACSDSHGGLG